MRYGVQSPMAPRRSDAVLEYWSAGKILSKRFLSALLHYSITPLLQYSEDVCFKAKTEAEGNMALTR